MISQEEYNQRLAQLLESGVDARIAPTRAVLEYGLQNNNITQEEADYVISTLKSFIKKHPGYLFLTPQEKHQIKQHGAKINDREEKKMWANIQPILDKAQGMRSLKD